MASRKQEHIEQIAEWCLIAQKNFSFKERAERDWKYWCKRRQRVNRHFAAPSAWVFVFLICVKKTISMKILVLRVINSLRHRNCFVRGYIHSLFVPKALTRSYPVARSGFWHKQLGHITYPVHHTCYDVNYIYELIKHVERNSCLCHFDCQIYLWYEYIIVDYRVHIEIISLSVHVMRCSNRNFNIPLLGKPRAFDYFL